MYQDDDLDFFRAAQEAPDRDALLWEDRLYTYQDLAPLVEKMSNFFRAKNLPEGAMVALCANNSLDLYCAILSLITEKISFVLVHPRLTKSERQVIVDDARPALYLDEEKLHGLASLPSPLSAKERGDHEVVGEDPILAVLYTSGTTGRPKGAVLARSAFITSAEASAQNLGWRDNDRWLLCLPLCHIGGLSIVVRCLLARRCVVLQPRFEAQRVLQSLKDQRVTLLSVVPTMMKSLLDVDAENRLSALRAVLVGGAATSETIQRECAARHIQALTTYGLTEACSQVSTQRLRDASIVEAGSGHPLTETSVEIIGEDGAILPSGEIGQIKVSGPTVMRGYLHQQMLGESGLWTGDLGFFDKTGALHIVSRRTDLIVTGGENVYPLEVERVIEGCAGVERALIFAAPDETWGQKVAAALVVTSKFSLATFQEECKDKLASHKRPRLYCIVDELPVLPSGKPDRAGAFHLLQQDLRAL